MVKLIRYTFGEKKTFLNGKGNLIDFDFIQKLFILQETEGCHLANKLRKYHIFFFKQKMKVKLATQLLCQSVADSLKFSEVNGTMKFIEIFNARFDILNPRSIYLGRFRGIWDAECG